MSLKVGTLRKPFKKAIYLLMQSESEVVNHSLFDSYHDVNLF